MATDCPALRAPAGPHPAADRARCTAGCTRPPRHRARPSPTTLAELGRTTATPGRLRAADPSARRVAAAPPARRRRHRARLRRRTRRTCGCSAATPMQFLLELERRERERTGLSSLKLGFNRVQGFYIEVNRSQAARVPRTTCAARRVKSAERFITPELKSFEDKVLGARDRALARERELYEALLDDLDRTLPALQQPPPRLRKSMCSPASPNAPRRSTACGPNWSMIPYCSSSRAPPRGRACRPRTLHSQRPAFR